MNYTVGTWVLIKSKTGDLRFWRQSASWAGQSWTESWFKQKGHFNKAERHLGFICSSSDGLCLNHLTENSDMRVTAIGLIEHVPGDWQSKAVDPGPPECVTGAVYIKVLSSPATSGSHCRRISLIRSGCPLCSVWFPVRLPATKQTKEPHPIDIENMVRGGGGEGGGGL